MRDSEAAAAVVRATLNATPSWSGWYRVNCPFCIHVVGKWDRGRALAVSTTSGWYKCWRCSTTGFVSELGGGEEYETPIRESVDDVPEVETPPGCLPLWGDVHPGMTSVLAYLDSRGMDAALRAHVRPLACSSGRYRGRVIVPVVERGRQVGFVARALGDANIRYLYPDAMERGQVFFAGDALSIETDEPAPIVEGVFDAVPFYPHAPALLGKPSDVHLARIAAAPRPVVWVLDGDAHREAWAWSKWCAMQGARSTCVRLPPKTDPGELPSEIVWAAVRKSAFEGVDVRLNPA